MKSAGRAKPRKPGTRHWLAWQAEKASRKPFLRRILGQLNNKEEDGFTSLFSELCCIKTPQGFIPRCPPHGRANPETCRAAGPFRRRDRCHCQQPPCPSRSPQRPSHPQLEKERRQNSKSRHDFGPRQQFPNFAARQKHLGRF